MSNFYFVATPIGNLKDISERAIEVLKCVDIILCEDTNHSVTLLKTYGISCKTMSFHKFNYKKMLPVVERMLLEGKSVALISDAGTPAICDPGTELIEMLRNNQIAYTVIPGACAFVNAFVLSGFAMPLTFLGFLPEKNKERMEVVKEIKNYKSTLCFYEAVHNIENDLEFFYNQLGARKCVVVRELTKKFEEITHFNLGDKPALTLKGEFVLLIEGYKDLESENKSIVELFDEFQQKGFSKDESMKKIAKIKHISKSEVYKEIVVKNKS